MKRGFAIVRGADGHILASAASLPVQGDVTLQFSDGTRRATLAADKKNPQSTLL